MKHSITFSQKHAWVCAMKAGASMLEAHARFVASWLARLCYRLSFMRNLSGSRPRPCGKWLKLITVDAYGALELMDFGINNPAESKLLWVTACHAMSPCMSPKGPCAVSRRSLEFLSCQSCGHAHIRFMSPDLRAQTYDEQSHMPTATTWDKAQRILDNSIALSG